MKTPNHAHLKIIRQVKEKFKEHNLTDSQALRYIELRVITVLLDKEIIKVIKRPHQIDENGLK
jgi:hypothetical protein